MICARYLALGLFVVAALGACLSEEGRDAEVSVAEQGIVTTTQFISEESGQSDDGGAHCPAGKVAMGVECAGGYCDNIRLLCDDFPGTLGALQPWSEWFSEETLGRGCAGLDEWVTAIQCRGGWCDEMRVRCRKATNAGVRTVERNACITAGPTSEDLAPLSLEGQNRFIGGMSCQGGYCDNVSASACTPEVRCDSGLGCGYSAGAACQCDAACTSFGDCCPNKVSECGS
jgi:hypothetical protein